MISLKFMCNYNFVDMLAFSGVYLNAVGTRIEPAGKSVRDVLPVLSCNKMPHV